MAGENVNLEDSEEASVKSEVSCDSSESSTSVKLLDGIKKWSLISLSVSSSCWSRASEDHVAVLYN